MDKLMEMGILFIELDGKKVYIADIIKNEKAE